MFAQQKKQILLYQHQQPVLPQQQQRGYECTWGRQHFFENVAAEVDYTNNLLRHVCQIALLAGDVRGSAVPASKTSSTQPYAHTSTA